ncbi:50S ribosomal protein L23 [Candidatus Woesearchaeota archaeon]|nr:50S ribosomal protein L23 [Candidatus Woesearchaeota archaeon]
MVETKVKQRTLNNQIVKYAVATEKAIRMMEYENKLQFVVDRKARKNEVKQALETLFGIKAKRINTYVDRAGEKRAIVTLSKDTIALDIGTQLGIM